MKFRLVIPSFQFRDGKPAFKPRFFYGWAYNGLDDLSMVYYPIPFNYLVRCWRWLKKSVSYLKKK